MNYKQLLNGLPVEIKATNQDPSSLPPVPPVLIIEKDRKEYELLVSIKWEVTDWELLAPALFPM